MPRSVSAAFALSQDLHLFTDRAEEQQFLRCLLELPAEQPLPVLMFHGGDGSGKSWLLRKLRALLPPSLPSALLDFEPQPWGGRYPADQARALAEIRRQFAAIECPRFDLAYSHLRFRQGLKSEPLSKDTGLAGAAKEALAALASGVAADLASVRIFAERLSTNLDQAFADSWLERWLAKPTNRTDVLRLLQMTPAEIYPQLARRLIHDLTENLPALADCGVRGVLFLDNISALQPGPFGPQADSRVHWLQELYHSDAPILLVLAGRDRLSWEEDGRDKGRSQAVEQHHLVGLPEQAALTYLGHAGVTEPDLRAAVLRIAVEADSTTAGGATTYSLPALGLCADIVRNTPNARPAIFDMPPGDVAELARRFLRSFTSTPSEPWLRRLALTPRFDEAAARASFPSGPDRYPDTAWEFVCGCSFIRATAEPGWWTFRPPLNQTLLAAHDQTAADHRFWHEHWRQRSQNDMDYFAAIAWYHQYCLDPALAQYEWKSLARTCRKAGRMTEHYWLLSWWDAIDLQVRPATPVRTAEALVELAVEYCVASLGLQSENQRRAIACYEAALRVFTEADYPVQWAVIQNDLGGACAELQSGSRAENLRKAISCYEAALRVHTEAEYPAQWATVQNNLGAAYAELPSGDRGENLRRAIACYEAALRIYTESEYFAHWAEDKNNLGTVYADLPSGDRAKNLLQAIACYEAALKVHTEAGHVGQWAATLNNLGVAYTELPSGDRGENLRRAIACYEGAVGVDSEAEDPTRWAAAQNNLGNAYEELPSGDRTENLRRAIACYEAALGVYTEVEHPAQWAAIQNNLGAAYSDLDAGHHDDHLARAIACYKASLRVRSEDDYPDQWATTQNNLGIAYTKLHPEIPGENLRRALVCFKAALRQHTEADYPIDWSMSQGNSGMALEELAMQTDDATLGVQAVACFEAAERVYRRCGLPEEASAMSMRAAAARNRFSSLPSTLPQT